MGFSNHLLGLSGIIAASVISRRMTGRPIFYRQAPDTIYSEKWLSGSSTNFLLQFGGARNCLWTTVTPQRIEIRPHFPFNLGFIAEVWGLEHEIGSEDLISLDDGIFGSVVLVYRSSSGRVKKFRLHVRNRAEFIRAIESMDGTGSQKHEQDPICP